MKKLSFPTLKVYTCPYCGDSGERLSTNRTLPTLKNSEISAFTAFGPFNGLFRAEITKNKHRGCAGLLSSARFVCRDASGQSVGGAVLEKEDRNYFRQFCCRFLTTQLPYGTGRRKIIALCNCAYRIEFIEKNLWLSLENASNLWETKRL